MITPTEGQIAGAALLCTLLGILTTMFGAQINNHKIGNIGLALTIAPIVTMLFLFAIALILS